MTKFLVCCAGAQSHHQSFSIYTSSSGGIRLGSMKKTRRVFEEVILRAVISLLFLPLCLRAESDPVDREEFRILPVYSAVGDHARDAELGAYRLGVDLLRLRAFSGALIDLEAEMEFLRESLGQKERGYYTSDEHDQIESLLFRYLVCRESLWDMISFYSAYKETFPNSELQTRGFLIGFGAATHLAYYSSKVVASFLGNQGVIEKLNEEYFRLGIPEDTYENLFTSVTSVDNLTALKSAWLLYSDERENPDSNLSRISVSDPVYQKLMKQIDRMYAGAKAQTDYILEERSLLFPNIRNRLRHARIHKFAQKARETFGDNLYAARGILFERVSRVRSPLAAVITFAPAQIGYVKSLLKPGDIILTFTAGYMSNIFLPGMFKHGVTYVGSPEQRRNVGLSMEAFRDVPAGKQETLSKMLTQASLPTGDEADLIEGVAEGVIFSSLDHMLKTHINRLLVLRPRLSDVERVEQLTKVFLLLGNTYDFKFDFNNASYHCCTEVIYRALHRCGPIGFSLTPRMGKQTLSADDIIAYHLSAENKPFEFVLLAEEDTGIPGNHAIIRTGQRGKERFLELMGSNNSP